MIKPLYKSEEPFMEVRVGYGYQGVVMYDDSSDLVQCHVCGDWFENVGKHAQRKHDMPANEYKEKFGLAKRLGLCSKKYSEGRRLCALELRRQGKLRTTFNIGHHYANYKRKKHPLSFFNKNGLCDLQMRARFDVVAKIVGHDPTWEEVKIHDLQLSNVMASRQNYNKSREKLGLRPISAAERNMIPDAVLIAAIRRKRHEMGRRPLSSDFSTAGLSHTTIIKHFGSWNNALQLAGIK